jgi:hypothetical protein
MFSRIRFACDPYLKLANGQVNVGQAAVEEVEPSFSSENDY